MKKLINMFKKFLFFIFYLQAFIFSIFIITYFYNRFTYPSSPYEGNAKTYGEECAEKIWDDVRNETIKDIKNKIFLYNQTSTSEESKKAVMEDINTQIYRHNICGNKHKLITLAYTDDNFIKLYSVDTYNNTSEYIGDILIEDK